jgi:hypothetical protein
MFLRTLPAPPCQGRVAGLEGATLARPPYRSTRCRAMGHPRSLLDTLPKRRARSRLRSGPWTHTILPRRSGALGLHHQAAQVRVGRPHPPHSHRSQSKRRTHGDRHASAFRESSVGAPFLACSWRCASRARECDGFLKGRQKVLPLVLRIEAPQSTLDGFCGAMRRRHAPTTACAAGSRGSAATACAPATSPVTGSSWRCGADLSIG